MSEQQNTLNRHARDCAYVVDDGPAACSCGFWERENQSIDISHSLCQFEESDALGNGDFSLMRHAAVYIDRLRAALEWYGENARLARLIHSEGDKGRHALSDDGGKRAREALGE